MKKTNKLYKKAINLYNNGYIDKSISVCEKSIALDIRNSAALNLKGLLLYIKGDINEARRVWEINYKANNDMVSKKYLNDSRNDIDNKELYEESIDLINKIKIDEAIKKLEFCKNSDFNAININNALTTCYIKKGEFEKANVCIDEVLKIDKNNKIAKSNKKLLIKLGVIKRQIPIKKIFLYSASLFLLVLLIFTIKFSLNSIKFHKPNNDVKYHESDISKRDKISEVHDKEANKKINTEEKTKTMNKKELEKFPFEEINECINTKDIEELYEYVEKWDNKQLGINDKAIINKGKELLNKYACEFYYNKGLDAYKNEKYKIASEYFLRGIKYGKGHYPYEHDLYMLAVSYEKTNDIANSLRYYELYDREFTENKYIRNGTYIETVLYRLAMLYKSLDINKSKEYAKKLNEEYPKSQYNNSNINEIIKMK